MTENIQGSIRIKREAKISPNISRHYLGWSLRDVIIASTGAFSNLSQVFFTLPVQIGVVGIVDE